MTIYISENCKLIKSFLFAFWLELKWILDIMVGSAIKEELKKNSNVIFHLLS